MPDAAPLLLISTDFDGTLVEHGNPAPFAPLLMDVLSALRERGVRWAINTGRTLPSLEEGLETFALSVHPDFALTSERDLYRRTEDGQWEDYGDWNARCLADHAALFDRAEPRLSETVTHLQDKLGAKILYDHTVRNRHGRPELAGLMAQNEEHMQKIVGYLDHFVAEVPKLGYQRNSIYLRFCHSDYHKGATLAELGRLIGVPPQSIFAVGDHHNDIPMLDGRHAHKTACVGNSIGAVKELVTSVGGYVAGSDCSLGVIEALRFYCDGLPV